jgi:hypothetical protein
VPKVLKVAEVQQELKEEHQGQDQQVLKDLEDHKELKEVVEQDHKVLKVLKDRQDLHQIED